MFRRALAVFVVLMIGTGLLAFAPEAEAASWDWVHEGDMPSERTLFAGVRLPDGRLFISMGMVNNPVASLNETWIYDPDDGSWSQMSDSPLDGRVNSCAYLNGSVYVFTVIDVDTGHLDNRTLIYDVENDTWEFGERSPLYKLYTCAAAIDERYVLLAGGYPDMIADCYLYDTVNDTFEKTAPLPEGRSTGALVRDGGTVYYIGGLDPNINAVTDIFGFDVASRSWSAAGDLSKPNCAMSAVLGGDGLVYIIGGMDDPIGFTTLSKAWTWNPSNNRSGTLPDLPGTVVYSSAFHLDDGRVLYMGGYNASETHAGIYSLKRATVNVHLTSSSVGQGDSAWMSLSIAGAPGTTVNGTVDLVRNDTIWGSLRFSYPTDRPVMISFPIPLSLPAGDYLLEFRDVDVAGFGDYPLESLPLTVISAPSAEELSEQLRQELLAELEQVRSNLSLEILALDQQMTALQTMLEETRSGLGEVSDNVSTLQASLDLLETQVVLVQAQLEQMKVMAEMTNATLALLHERLTQLEADAGYGNESLAELGSQLTAMMGSMVALQGQLDEAQASIEEVNASLSASAEGSELQDQMDGKMDAVLGYVILMAVLASLVISVVVLVIMLRKR